MNLSEFYSDTDPEIWKKVLGEDLHYHVGWGDGDIMYNSVHNLYKFIGPNTKVLDCGCGWGGPAKVIQRDLKCKVTGVTNSKVQYDYIRKNLPITVILKDLHKYTSNEFYDTVVFIESFCHLKNPQKVIKNLSCNTNTVILREYYLKSNYEDCEKYLNKWLMTIYKKDEILDILSPFKLTYFEDHYKYALEPTLEYWLNNLSRIPKNEKTKHLQTLEISSRYLKKNLKDVLSGIGLATFVFKK